MQAWFSRLFGPKTRRAAARAAAWPLRTLLRLTRDGLLFALLALACASVAARSDNLGNIPLLIGLILFSMLITSLILGSTALRQVQVSRNCGERTFAGEPLAVTLTVLNQGRMPVAGLLLSERLRLHVEHPRSGEAAESQRLAPVPRRAGEAAGGRAFALAVFGRGQERTRYTLLVRRRGIYTFGRTHLSTVFPFGFWRSEASRRLPGRLVVYPRLGEIDSALFLEMERALEQLRRTRASREEMDFRSLRDYRHGDHPKWIHWRSSARMNKPLVKEFEEPQSRRVVLYVDTNLQRLGAQRLPAFELAVSFAATAVRELLRRGCEVTCVALPPGRPAEAVRVSRERRNLDACFELLAGLLPDSARGLADARTALPRSELNHAFVLVLGLGSLRAPTDLTWLPTLNNKVKILDVRGEEFRRVFRRHAPGAAAREEDEDLLLALGDEELDDLAREELALVG